MNPRVAPIAVLFLAALLPRAARGDDAPRKHVAVGDAVPAFAVKDTDGRQVTSASLRAVTDETVASAIRAAAGWDAAKTWKPEDSIGIVPGLQKDEAPIDPAKRLAFLRAAGRDFGLLVTETSAAKPKTMGDVAAWLKKAADAPIVFEFWFSRCPYVKGYADRVVALSTEEGARVYPIAANANEAMSGIKAAEAEAGYRVLLDPDQALCDILGGRRTPHAFLVDAKGVLRYAGAIDDDFMEELPAGERHSWLRDAVRSVAAGKPVLVPQTDPEGCSIKRKPS